MAGDEQPAREHLLVINNLDVVGLDADLRSNQLRDRVVLRWTLSICNDDREVGKEDGECEQHPHQPPLSEDASDDTHHSDTHGHGVLDHTRMPLLLGGYPQRGCTLSLGHWLPLFFLNRY